MSNYSKADINSRYDKLRAQLKAGTISQSNFKAAADRLYKLYHSKQNNAARTQTAKPQSKVQKAVKAVQAAKTKTSKQQGDGSVTAKKRKTSYDKEVERRNKVDKGWVDRTGAKDQAWSKANEKPLNVSPSTKSGPKKGDTKVVTIKVKDRNVTMVYDGSKWVHKNK